MTGLQQGQRVKYRAGAGSVTGETQTWRCAVRESLLRLALLAQFVHMQGVGKEVEER